MQKVLTQYGEGFVLEKDDSGRHVSYLVSGPGFKTWIAASDMPIGFNDEEISEPNRIQSMSFPTQLSLKLMIFGDSLPSFLMKRM